MPFAGLSIFGDARYLDAARPLFAAGAVDAIEWSVDSWSHEEAADEIDTLLDSYAKRGLLIGHGIHYPLLAVKADKLRANWLKQLKPVVQARKYAGVSVHFGFSTGWKLREGAPLPVPLCKEALDLGKKAMVALQKTVKVPVGIENLALAFSKQDVASQGVFIDEMLRAVDGYQLLDLHNIYCQSVNFGVPVLDLVKTYPLSRVLEIHVSGGSWSEHGKMKVRRDTHDGRVPQELFDALPAVLKLCPRARFVIFEKLPQSFKTKADTTGFRDDFMQLKALVPREKAAA
ncbi:MAG: DUF692 family protein [Alphaproteobacteria bacterium]|nr:MAG: DUF692 family protein [Alphaproteobacteria bacterium]